MYIHIHIYIYVVMCIYIHILHYYIPLMRQDVGFGSCYVSEGSGHDLLLPWSQSPESVDVLTKRGEVYLRDIECMSLLLVANRRVVCVFAFARFLCVWEFVRHCKVWTAWSTVLWSRKLTGIQHELSRAALVKYHKEKLKP